MSPASDLTPQEIRTLREAAGLSRPQLAKALGYAPATVKAWELPRAKGGKRMTRQGRDAFVALLNRIADDRARERQTIADLKNRFSTPFGIPFGSP